MVYRCIPLDTVAAAGYRKATVDDFGYSIHRFRSDSTHPCRHCLLEASAARGMLLLAYQLPQPASVYGHRTAIFLCAEECARFVAPNTVPPIVSNRHVSFRAFDTGGMMLYDANELVEGTGHDTAIRRIFDNPKVAFINAHTAKAGCMLCHIVRESA